MASRKLLRKKSLFENPRYWYHISSTLTDKRVYLKPWDNSGGFNRGSDEPDVHQTCVAPSVEKCLTALPYGPEDEYIIYRTYHKTKATKAYDVFDCSVTQEGWIQQPCMFVKLGTLTFRHVAEGECVNIIDEAASSREVSQSEKVLKWWQRCHLNKHIKWA